MRKTVTLVAALAVATTGVAVASGAAAPGQGDARWSVGAWRAPTAADEAQSIPADETIVLIAKVTKERFVDVRPRGESVGDYFLVREALFNEEGGRVGRVAYRCMLQFLPDLHCDGSNVLRGRGQITFAVVLDTSRETFPPVPLTGGSGDFANVGGQMLIEPQNGEEVLTLQILRFD